MILVDTSVWVDHLRGSDTALVALLDRGDVLMHSFIIGELALGNLRQRDQLIEALRALPHAQRAADSEVMRFIEDNRLFGLGIGYIDAHLLAAVRLTQGTLLWTRDKRLAGVAARLRLAAANL